MFGKWACLLVAFSAVLLPLEASLVDSIKGAIWAKPKKAAPTINVLIVNDQPAIMVEARGKYKIYDPNTSQHISSRVIGKRKLIQSLPGGLKWGEEFPGIYQLHLIPDGPGSSIVVDGIEYPGSVFIYDVGGTLSIVNQVSLEDYLHRTLASQYTEELPQETLAAVAIAARSLALYQASHSSNSFWSVDGSKVGYSGERKALSKELLDAINNTKQMVLTQKSAYEGSLTPLAAEWGPAQSGRQQGAVLSRISLFDAEQMARKGMDAAKILSAAYPSAHIEIIP